MAFITTVMRQLPYGLLSSKAVCYHGIHFILDEVGDARNGGTYISAFDDYRLIHFRTLSTLDRVLRLHDAIIHFIEHIFSFRTLPFWIRHLHLGQFPRLRGR